MLEHSSKKNRTNTLVFLFQKLWKFGNGCKKQIVLYLIMFVVANSISLLTPLLFKEFIDEIQINGLGPHNIQYLVLILFGILGVSLLFWVFHGPARVIQKKVAFRVRNNYREYLVSRTLGFDFSWHAERDSGNSIDKINKSTLGLFKFINTSNNVIFMVIKAIGTVAILMFFNLYVGLLASTILIITIYITYLFDLRLVPQYRKLNIFDNKISAKIFDVFSNITSVKILGIEKVSLKNIKKHFWNPFSLYKENTNRIEWKWFTGHNLFTGVIVFPIMLYILFLNKKGLAVEVGTLSAMYLYLGQLRLVYRSFAGIYEEMMVQKAQVQNADEIENLLLEKNQNKVRDNIGWQKLSLLNLKFRYQDAHETEPQNLNGLNFSINRGEKIACIGESGSGKTTFLKVIHGLYNNVQAEIVFDDNESFPTNFVNINLQTTLVPQEPELFSSSIRENVTFGLDFSDDEIRHMLSLAEFSKTLEELPKDLDSVVNEKGVNLSGGQKQRLALARALLFSKDKEIVLLDESTSSVDPSSEVKIYKNIFSEFSEKTFIASIHKMNLLRYFDSIVIFEKGDIVDSGSFKELYGRNIAFAKQWDEYIQQEK